LKYSIRIITIMYISSRSGIQCR